MMKTAESTAKPSMRILHWNQFGLRTILAVVTMIAVCLGGRIEYLRRNATFHEREAKRHLEKLESECQEIFARHGVLDDFLSLATTQERIDFIGNLRLSSADDDPDEVARLNNDSILLMQNHFLAIAYRKTSLTPWMPVDTHLPTDTQPPTKP